MEYGSLISIVMPVYNRAHLMPRVLGSLLAQSYRNFEILVVDDCSTDDIDGAVAAMNDPRIRLIKRETNGGVAAGRNTGIAAARGELIAFHDSDDYATFDRLELSMRKLLSLPDDYVGVYGICYFYTEVDSANYAKMTHYMRPVPGDQQIEGDLAKRSLAGNILNFPTLLVKADAVRAAGPCDELLRKNVDWDLALRLTRQGKFGFIPEPIYMSPISQDPAVSAKRVSRSERQGARSFARISGKLRRQGVGGLVMASHYATTGRYLMRLERPRAARRFFRASLGLNKAQPKLWVHFALSHMPALHAMLRPPKRL